MIGVRLSMNKKELEEAYQELLEDRKQLEEDQKKLQESLNEYNRVMKLANTLSRDAVHFREEAARARLAGDPNKWYLASIIEELLAKVERQGMQILSLEQSNLWLLEKYTEVIKNEQLN
jgi:hypothetical protein